jgi:hypothetical protein
MSSFELAALAACRHLALSSQRSDPPPSGQSPGLEVFVLGHDAAFLEALLLALQETPLGQPGGTRKLVAEKALHTYAHATFLFAI